MIKSLPNKSQSPLTMSSLSLDLTRIFLFALLNVLVFVLGTGSQKLTVLLLIWLMCFLTKAFAAGLSRHCGQGSGPHLFLFIQLLPGKNVWYGSQNRAWLKIKCGRTSRSFSGGDNDKRIRVVNKRIYH